MSMMEIENWNTTNTLRKEKPFAFTFRIPFRTFTGINDDINRAGYIPLISPMKKGSARTGTNTCQLNKAFTVNASPDILAIMGNVKHVKPNATNNENQQIKTDSLKN